KGAAAAHEALVGLSADLSGLLREFSTILKAEVSAKEDDANKPGSVLAQLLAGGLGGGYKTTLDVLWDGSESGWCGDGVVLEAIGGVISGQATSCQRLLSVVSERLASLQRWEK
ncbi:unnamed protein product, partial [Discosporangium mesarthrocarpum]